VGILFPEAQVPRVGESQIPTVSIGQTPPLLRRYAGVPPEDTVVVRLTDGLGIRPVSESRGSRSTQPDSADEEDSDESVEYHQDLHTTTIVHVILRGNCS